VRWDSGGRELRGHCRHRVDALGGLGVRLLAVQACWALPTPHFISQILFGLASASVIGTYTGPSPSPEAC
jgi:hypothetical protein